MSTHKVKGVYFVSRPIGKPTLDTLKVGDVEIPTTLAENQIRWKTIYLSVDPYFRSRMRTWELNLVPSGWAFVKVTESKVPTISTGSYYVTQSNWQEEVVSTVPQLFVHVHSESPEIFAILGISGLTAIIGIETIGKIKQGETVVISGAAGSVGILAGQIAKNRGCHVIGTCGSDEKCQVLKSHGFDHAINYKTTTDIKAALKAASPKGNIDVYFDNVGGNVSDAVMELIAPFARIVVCGQISVYNEDDPNSPALKGPRNWWNLIYTGARIEGFSIPQHAAQWPVYIEELLKFHKEGKLRTPICVENGLENFGKAFLDLFAGGNTGKQIVKV